MRECKCPSCNANLTIKDDNREFAFCEYCGTKVLLDDYRSTERIVDEAKIKMAEATKAIKLKEFDFLSKESKMRNFCIIAWGSIILIFFIIAIIADSAGNHDLCSNCLAIACIIGLGGLIVFYFAFKYLAEQKDKKDGKIRIRYDIISNQTYESLKMELESLGFTNIRTVNMQDLKTGLIVKPGTVASLTCDGVVINKNSSGIKRVDPTAPATITYHGFPGK